MNADVFRVVEDISSTLILAFVGWVFRSVRRYIRALHYAQRDISTLWVHAKLPRKLRSGSYARSQWGDEETESVTEV